MVTIANIPLKIITISKSRIKENSTDIAREYFRSIGYATYKSSAYRYFYSKPGYTIVSAKAKRDLSNVFKSIPKIGIVELLNRKRGHPDLLIIDDNGKGCFVEVKRVDDPIHQDQCDWLIEASLIGANIFVLLLSFNINS